SPIPQGADDAATELISIFSDTIQSVYGIPWEPKTNCLAIARDFWNLKPDIEFFRCLFKTTLEKNQRNGVSPPHHLKYFQKPLQQALEERSATSKKLEQIRGIMDDLEPDTLEFDFAAYLPHAVPALVGTPVYDEWGAVLEAVHAKVGDRKFGRCYAGLLLAKKDGDTVFICHRQYYLAFLQENNIAEILANAWQGVTGEQLSPTVQSVSKEAWESLITLDPDEAPDVPVVASTYPDNVVQLDWEEKRRREAEINQIVVEIGKQIRGKPYSEAGV
ncbi:MAG: hypothetical protein KDJ42_00030, partial [Alphaproteobacteria bacterium]|nr:hypothetical protein [Alphaproteobacteria bacterium]